MHNLCRSEEPTCGWSDTADRRSDDQLRLTHRKADRGPPDEDTEDSSRDVHRHLAHNLATGHLQYLATCKISADPALLADPKPFAGQKVRLLS